MGRKSKWETHVLPRLADISEMVNTMNEEQIAAALGIAESTFNDYKTKYPELVEALRKGRADLVTKCRNNLQRRADGYEYEEVKTTEQYVDLPDNVKEMLLEAGVEPERVSEAKAVLVKVETTRKHEKPDVAANNALLRVHDPEWHESTAEARQLRREELDIKKKRAEADAW